jgi:cytochrome c
MKLILGASLIAAGLVIAGPASASMEMAKKDGCLNCHAVAEKKVGPSYKDVAAKYKGKADPKVKASEDDVKALVKWILAM